MKVKKKRDIRIMATGIGPENTSTPQDFGGIFLMYFPSNGNRERKPQALRRARIIPLTGVDII